MIASQLRLLVVIAAAFAFRAAAAAPAEPGAEVSVVRDGDSWTAEFKLTRSAPAWAFIHSSVRDFDDQPWRPSSWTIETPGVRLVRRGRYDLFTARAGDLPRRIRIRFSPVQAGLEGSYSPALVFSDGAVALFTDQFDLTPLASAEAALRLPVDPDGIPLSAGPTRKRFRDVAGPVLFRGVRQREAITTEGESYVLFGKASLVQSADVATVIDPQLPQWLSGQLATETSRMLAYYADRLGPFGGPKPLIMASWAGATPNLVSMTGGVLPALVLMTFEGSGLASKDDRISDHVRWFVAHETAHFWLGNAVAYDKAEHAWMMEGGADLLAVRALAELDHTYDPRPRLNDALAHCVSFPRGRPINSANALGAQSAYYSCGAVFSLVAEAAANKAKPGSGLAGFWRPLIASNRSSGIVTQDQWLAQLTHLSGDRKPADAVRRLAERGSSDPRRDIAALLRHAGIRFEESGKELRLP